MTLQRDMNDMIEPIDKHEPIDNSEPADAIEPTERIDPTDAIEPTERTDPTDATDSTDPFEAIDNTESPDHRNHLELSRARRIRWMLRPRHAGSCAAARHASCGARRQPPTGKRARPGLRSARELQGRTAAVRFVVDASLDNNRWRSPRQTHFRKVASARTTIELRLSSWRNRSGSFV